MLQSWHIAINVCCYLSYFSLFVQVDIAVLYMCIMYTFFKKLYIFSTNLHVSDCKFIKSKNESAKYM